MLVRPGRTTPVVPVCWEHLAESPIRRSFNSHLRAKFDHVPREAEDIDSEWALFRAFIVEVLTRAVVIRWSMPVVVETPSPTGEHWW